MSLLKKLFGGSAPGWAQPIKDKEFLEFQSQVLEFVSSTGQTVSPDWNTGTLRFKNPDHVMNLHNLLGLWKKADQPSRPEAVSRFLGGLLSAATAEKQSIDHCLDQLKIRIYDIESPGLEYVAKRPIGKHLFEGIVIDGEVATTTVSPDRVSESEQSEDSIFEIARQNTWKGVSTEMQRGEMHLGQMTVLIAEYYGASQIALLDKYVESGETYWVSTPSRDITFLLKPVNESKDRLTEFVKLSAETSRKAGNFYLMPVVLEYKDGTFRDLCTAGGGQMGIL